MISQKQLPLSLSNESEDGVVAEVLDICSEAEGRGNTMTSAAPLKERHLCFVFGEVVHWKMHS